MRSDSLYRRIARLEEVLTSPAAAPAGVRTHLARLEQAFGQ